MKNIPSIHYHTKNEKLGDKVAVVRLSLRLDLGSNPFNLVNPKGFNERSKKLTGEIGCGRKKYISLSKIK